MTPGVVLLHGFTHTGASWEPVIAELPQRYRAVVAPDLRGHGSASGAVPVDLDAVVGDLAAAAPERFVLAGYSMGGRIALHVALALPQRVSALVLVGASPGLGDPRERAERRRADEALADQVQAMSIDLFARRWAQTPVLAGVSPEVAARTHADRLRSSPAGLARALRGLGTGALPSLWDRLGELRPPVTLAAGARDAKFGAIARAMAARIPGAEVVIVPGAGHAAHLEAPGVIAQLIAAAGCPAGAQAPSSG